MTFFDVDKQKSDQREQLMLRGYVPSHRDGSEIWNRQPDGEEFSFEEALRDMKERSK